MALSNDQVIKLIKTPINAPNLKKAIDHESRLKFHTNVITDTHLISNTGDKPESIKDLPYYTIFLTWVKTILKAPDKYEQFKRLLVFPLKTNEIVDDISDEYVKIFNAEDSFVHIEFKDDALKSDFSEFLDSINIEEFWHDDCFNAMMKAINSIIIVDMPQIQESDWPEPYVYLIDINKVIDYKQNQKGDFIYLIFKVKDDYVAVFDEEFYRLYHKEGDSYMLMIQSPHDLQYCPAKSFWSDTVDNLNPINKHAPLSSNLGRLDWQLFFETAKESLDIYAAYPIYWAYESTCDYKDQDGNPCVEGNIISLNDQDKIIGKCPICASKLLVGPGSLIEAPLPIENVTLQVPPAGIIPIERQSLDYNVQETDRLRAQIIAGATGKNKLIQNTAINQDQVQSQFENQTNILNWIARNFEKAHKWTIDTLGKLRYGDSYGGSSVYYGSSWYLQSVDDAIQEYSKSKAAGMPAYILAVKMAKIEHIQSKNNYIEKNRLEIMRYLEPYPLLTLNDLKNLGIDVTDPKGFLLKANFYTFVSQFELEYGSILEFGSALELKTKIDKIKAKLLEYVNLTLTGSTNQNQ
jgi:hypothetical protein